MGGPGSGGRNRYWCDEPGCTGRHGMGKNPPAYSELCPAYRRRKNAKANSSKYRDRWNKYDGSTKGVLRKVRLNIRQKEEKLHGATD